MTSLESIERLRESLNDCTTEAGVEPNRFDTYWITARACDILIDEIEREIAERYMELPVDADGVPIHLGDMVEGEQLFDNATVKGTVTTYHIHDDDEPGTVYVRVKPTEDTWTIKELRFTRCRHVKPRTVEDVLRDYWREACELPVDMSDESTAEAIDKLVVKYRAEICDLLDGDCS